MQFVLAPSNAYWWPVTVRMPDPDSAGKFLEQKFEIRFEPRDQDADLAERARILAIEDPAGQQRADRKSLADVCKGWRGVVTPDKAELPFNATNLDAALQKPWIRIAVWQAYWDSVSGQEARLGN